MHDIFLCTAAKKIVMCHIMSHCHTSSHNRSFKTVVLDMKQHHTLSHSIMLHHTSHSITLHRIASQSIMLHHTLHHTGSCYVTQHHITLHSTTLYHKALHSTTPYITLQYKASHGFSLKFFVFLCRCAFANRLTVHLTIYATCLINYQKHYYLLFNTAYSVLP